MSAISDNQALQLLRRPAVVNVIKDFADEIVKQRLESSERRISSLEAHVKDLEQEVDGFRCASDALETSNIYNWDLTDERFRALEATAAARHANGGHESHLTGSELAREHATVEGTLITSQDIAATAESTGGQSARFVDLEPAHGMVDTSTNTQSETDTQTTSNVKIDDYKMELNNASPTRHPKSLSSGHLAFYYDIDKIVLWMPITGQTMHRRRLLFHIPPLENKDGCTYKCSQLGQRAFEPDFNGHVMRQDILLPRSPGNLKLLIKLYYFLRARKADLVEQWTAENRDFVGIMAPIQPYEVEPAKSLRFHQLRAMKVPMKITVDVLVPRKSGIVPINEPGLTVQKRLLVERTGAFIGGSAGNHTTIADSTYYDVATEHEVQKGPSDAVISESEELYERLGIMYGELGEADLLDAQPHRGAAIESLKRLSEASAELMDGQALVKRAKK